jgi:hypothetical protein
MRICPTCNTNNKESAIVCKQCGHKFGKIIRPSKKNDGGGKKVGKDPYHVGTTIDGTEITYDPRR